MPGNTGVARSLREHPSAHAPLPCRHPWPCVHTRAHAHTFPRQEAALCQERMECRFPEGVLGLRLRSRTAKKGPSVCGGGCARGAFVSAHVYLGPKKNPQLAVLSSATPGLSHIPSLPEPTLGGPTTQRLHLPPHQQGDLGQAPVGQPASASAGAAPQAPKQPETTEGPSGLGMQGPPVRCRGRAVLPSLAGTPRAPCRSPSLIPPALPLPRHRDAGCG